MRIRSCSGACFRGRRAKVKDTPSLGAPGVGGHAPVVPVAADGRRGAVLGTPLGDVGRGRVHFVHVNHRRVVRALDVVDFVAPVLDALFLNTEFLLDLIRCWHVVALPVHIDVLLPMSLLFGKLDVHIEGDGADVLGGGGAPWPAGVGSGRTASWLALLRALDAAVSPTRRTTSSIPAMASRFFAGVSFCSSFQT